MPSTPDKKLRALARKRDKPDFAKLAEKFRGMVIGPRDLSTREGYGKASHLF